MEDSTKAPGFDNDYRCPVHHTECKKVYDFGERDAELTVFSGCSCAVTQQFDPCGTFEYEARYFTSYNAASGLARFIAMENNARFGGSLGSY